MSSISFFSEDIVYTLKNKIKVRKWIATAISAEGFTLKELNFIFCSDEYLLRYNKEFLKHDTLTDVITFDNSEVNSEIFGDIFISIPRVIENAEIFNVTSENELHRVMIHGALHLLGYSDKGKSAKAKMTFKENFYLNLR